MSPTKARMTEAKGRQVTFPALLTQRFNYHVTPKRIWIENHATKQQWACEIASTDDFAVKGAGIPEDLVMEYVVVALGKLSTKATTNKHECQADLIPIDKTRLRLDLELRFDVAGVIWNPEYLFILEPVEVSETEILKAKIQDLELELYEIRQLLREREVPSIIVIGDRLVETSKTLSTRVVLWMQKTQWWFGHAYRGMQRALHTQIQHTKRFLE
ncbi:hypothetical protein Poli38472_013661 [Pythium oligandrum]|uniref:Uncharacterized protein n=1 Tax=Pythium oligandrum TaxID=41045 RepID=A0A8K1FJY5_PYTOL|nr:hypothetical protein Poli38472_013661 [Pythium oligandrum]|eukprot:TMW61198.1 hypothetical protein Poli38472_013661 [Pythium oligandrum]